MQRDSVLPVRTERRVLIIDDTPSVCDDFRKILCPQRTSSSINELEASLFGPERGSRRPQPDHQFQVDTANQGQEGFASVRRMLRLGTPYALAFIDMRMPPGWDGVETAARIWKADPAIQIVICSAYSDYSWNESSHASIDRTFGSSTSRSTRGTCSNWRGPSRPSGSRPRPGPTARSVSRP